MSGLVVTPLDAGDRAELDAWHAVYLAAEHATGDDVGAPWQLEEVRVLMQGPGTRAWSAGFSGRVDGELVCAGWIRTPMLDNLDRAELSVHTAPGRTRQGYATAMLAHLEQVARERGRSVLTGNACWPYVLGPDGAGSPGRELARGAGYDLALGDVKRVLRLPVADGVLERLAAEAAPHHRDHELRSWVGPVPDELLADWARLDALVETEAPTGDLTLEPATTDPAVVREAEAMLAAQGRTSYHSVALGPDGRMVAFTQVVTTVHEPGRAYQWGTLVERAARGRRLGIAVKVANLRLLEAEAPGIRLLSTYNAEVNAPMVGVNEGIGFVPVARMGEFQRLLT
ncbi:GNAT family N-acetyltransferase [Nocardioides sp. URHA0032]|uniref:GNAT family N-acetyltransferase n=1 Tax=Nocardioides sp. URHA0032 TaxID=1380388 RepID=UPI00048F2EA2|nr:GNAT family N-acetyltransferase [Nocardioides sp. URHA0032]